MNLKILEPINGSILNRYDGTARKDSLEITVKGTCPENVQVEVNHEQADCSHGKFSCKVLLNDKDNLVEARATGAGPELRDSVHVFWDKATDRLYRFSIDDNIYFLKDLSRNHKRYSSLFDNDYLAFWKEIHEEYDAKIHFNIYYQTEGFNLSEMPQKYKAEWQDASNWLRLTFHALQNKPDRPYLNGSYEEMHHDFTKVTEQIARFAGNELVSPFTTIHWCEAPLEACRALRDCGIRGLIGGFRLGPKPLPVEYYVDENVRNAYETPRAPYGAYYLDYGMAKYMCLHEYWKDIKEDMIFIKGDVCVNHLEKGEVEQRLDTLSKNPHVSGLIEALVHEQYFLPQLPHYQPDIKEKVKETFEWLTRNGYRSVFYEEFL